MLGQTHGAHPYLHHSGCWSDWFKNVCSSAPIRELLVVMDPLVPLDLVDLLETVVHLV